MKRLLWTASLAALMIGGTLAQVNAEGISPRHWPEPIEATDAAPSPHRWYVGVLGGFFWLPDDMKVDEEDRWSASVVGGYLWQSDKIGLGVEADHTMTSMTDFELDQGISSVRGRAGVFVAPGTFLYATGGVAKLSMDDFDGFDRGLVVGGGLEVDATERIFVRGEVLHYRHTDEYFGWGDHGTTSLRVGMGVKF